MNGFLYQADGTSSCICLLISQLFISKDVTPFSFSIAAFATGFMPRHQAAFSFLKPGFFRYLISTPFK